MTIKIMTSNPGARALARARRDHSAKHIIARERTDPYIQDACGRTPPGNFNSEADVCGVVVIESATLVLLLPATRLDGMNAGLAPEGSPEAENETVSPSVPFIAVNDKL
jgi:hypothetical protein